MTEPMLALEIEHSPRGKFVAVATRWVRWSYNYPRTEMRRPRTDFDPEMLVTEWARSGKQATIVHNKEELRRALASPGALVATQEQVRRVLPFLDEPRSCVNLRSVGTSGFADIQAIPAALTRRRPSERVRRAVMLRDRYCCRNCGELAVANAKRRPPLHHWIPWKDGGLTHPHNLLLLCEGCHKKIEALERRWDSRDASVSVTRPTVAGEPSWFRSNRLFVRLEDVLPVGLRR